MKRYDMHTHILPGIDDGSKSVDQSVELLNGLKTQGLKLSALLLTTIPIWFLHRSFLTIDIQPLKR